MLCCVVEYGEDVWRVRTIIPYIYKVYIKVCSTLLANQTQYIQSGLYRWTYAYIYIYMYMCCGVLTTPSFVPCPRSPFIDFLGDFLPYTVLSQQLYSSSEIADMCCGRTLVCIQPVLIVTRIRQRSTLFKSLPQKIRES